MWPPSGTTSDELAPDPGDEGEAWADPVAPVALVVGDLPTAGAFDGPGSSAASGVQDLVATGGSFFLFLLDVLLGISSGQSVLSMSSCTSSSHSSLIKS